MKAGKVYATFSVAFGATWDAETNTMKWNSVGNYYPNFRILNTGLPNGDITKFTKFHATLLNFSPNATYIRLRIKDTSDNYADANLVSGENNIDFASLKSQFSSCDFSNIADITIWSPGTAEEGKTVDADNPASVKIESVYLQTPQNIPDNSFGDEITSFEYIADGTPFAIGDGTNALYWTTASVDRQSAPINDLRNDAYCFYKIEKVDGLDTDGDETVENDNYRISVVNASGTAYPHPWGYGNYVNYSQYNYLWAASCALNQGHDYGRDGDYYAIWKIVYSEGNGFYLKNAGSGRYATLSYASTDISYLKFYKTINFTLNTELDKEENEANDDIFALSRATGYDEETGTMTNGTWSFDTPVDISNWDYLVITTIDNASDKSRIIRITDDNGNSIAGSDYKGTDAETGNCSMYFDPYNNQNAIRISIDYLRVSKNIDVSKIKSVSIRNSYDSEDCVLRISNVYLTDYNNDNIRKDNAYSTGNVVREYSATGKFGTICLPYKSSVSGGIVYSISGKGDNSITLERVDGLLEAGKPYIYMSADERGKDNGGTVRNVNFFRADETTYDAATAGSNNGLIGTFSDITLTPNDNFYVLSNNMLYKVDAGATGELAVHVGANKAYIDKSLITNTGSSSSRSAVLFFDDSEATNVNGIMSKTTEGRIEFYNLSGQRVAHPTKGLYIVNGKKVVIK